MLAVVDTAHVSAHKFLSIIINHAGPSESVNHSGLAIDMVPKSTHSIHVIGLSYSSSSSALCVTIVYTLNSSACISNSADKFSNFSVHSIATATDSHLSICSSSTIVSGFTAFNSSGLMSPFELISSKW